MSSRRGMARKMAEVSCLSLMALGWGSWLTGCPQPDNAPAKQSSQPLPEGAIRIGETTNPIVSEHEVAPGNIFERELPGPDGVVAKRMSAVLSIMDRASQREWTETVIVGSKVTLGADVYRVHAIAAGTDNPGSITLAKVPP